MAGYSWEGCPAAGGFVWLLPMRARTRSTSCAPVHGLRHKLRCERLSGVGLRAAIWRSFESERSWGTAGEEDSSGRRRLLRCRAPLKLVERVAPSAPTTLLQLKQTKQHVVIYNSERAQSNDSLDGAPQPELHTLLLSPLCSKTPPAKRS